MIRVKEAARGLILGRVFVPEFGVGGTKTKNSEFGFRGMRTKNYK